MAPIGHLDRQMEMRRFSPARRETVSDSIEQLV